MRVTDTGEAIADVTLNGVRYQPIQGDDGQQFAVLDVTIKGDSRNTFHFGEGSLRLATTVFPVDPAFKSTSYKDRYAILCQRLVRERLYDAACFVTSSKDPEQAITQPDPEIGFANFVAAIAGRAAYIRPCDHPSDAVSKPDVAAVSELPSAL